MSITKELIEEAINEIEDVTGETFHHILEEVDYYIEKHKNIIKTELSFELVHEVGGHEGGGERVERVLKVTDKSDNVAYIEYTGFYASHAGTDMESDFTMVEPHEVMVTQYKLVK